MIKRFFCANTNNQNELTLTVNPHFLRVFLIFKHISYLTFVFLHEL